MDQFSNHMILSLDETCSIFLMLITLETFDCQMFDDHISDTSNQSFLCLHDFLFIFSLHSHSKKWFCLSMRSLSYNYLTISLYFWKPPIEACLYTVISSDHYLLPSEDMIRTYVFAFDYIFSFTWTPSWVLSMSLTYIMRIIFTRVTQWGIRGGIKYC